MSLLRKLAGMLHSRKASATEHAAPGITQAVIVKVEFDGGLQEPLADFWEFEDRLVAVVESSGRGQFDGNEIATDGSHAFFYLYAPNADDLLSIVGPFFVNEAMVKDASFVLRYGEVDDPFAREITLSLEQVRKIYGGAQRGF